MRVAHLDTETTWRGGEQQALHLAAGLAARGVESLLIVPPGAALGQEGRRRGLAVREVLMRGEFDPLAARAVRRLAREFGADLLHLHTGHAVGLGQLAFPFGGLAKIIARRVDFPIRRGLGRLKYTRGVRRILCVSEGIRRVLLECGVPPALATTVHSGIDPARFEGPLDPAAVRRELELDAADPLLVNVAALSDHKGHRYLLEAMPRVLARRPRARLAIAGQGELEEPLVAQCERLKLAGHVRFLGYRRDIPNLLAAADLFVLSSHLEGLCTSLLDAMAMGRAVVATRAGGIPEAVWEGETGLLTPPRDPAALAEAILELLGDAPRRAAMGAAGRARVLAHFTVDAMVEKTLAAYREAVPAPISSPA